VYKVHYQDAMEKYENINWDDKYLGEKEKQILN
jgi:hypothetical protein